MYYVDESGNRVYTLKKVDPSGKPTLSAHPGNAETMYSRAQFAWGHMLDDCLITSTLRVFVIS